MPFLALDTATPELTLAIGDENGRLRAAWSARAPRMHATLLHPALDELLADLGLEPGDIEGVAVGIGPGSYTGVRIGVTAAKTWAFACRVPVAGVSSLAAAARAAVAGAGAGASREAVGAAVWDARRGDVYAGAYEARALRGTAAAPPLIASARVDGGEFADRLAALPGVREGRPVLLCGDAAARVAALLLERCPGCRCGVGDERAAVRAEDVLALGLPSLAARLRNRKEGDDEQDAHALVPGYLQLAEAEARWRSRQGSDADGS